MPVIQIPFWQLWFIYGSITTHSCSRGAKVSGFASLFYSHLLCIPLHVFSSSDGHSLILEVFIFSVAHIPPDFFKKTKGTTKSSSPNSGSPSVTAWIHTNSHIVQCFSASSSTGVCLVHKSNSLCSRKRSFTCNRFIMITLYNLSCVLQSPVSPKDRDHCTWPDLHPHILILTRV